MDLTAALLRFAARRPHVLVVPTVGGTAARLGVEVELARRGWPAAEAPANADVLLVAGPAGPAMSQVVDRVWPQIPAPRTRTVVRDAAQVAAVLDASARRLGDTDEQRRSASSRRVVVGHGGSPRDAAARGSGDHDPRRGEHSRVDDERPDRPDSANGDQGPTESVDRIDHADGGHSAHHGHDGGGMELPGGLVMADLGEDRDGLTLDRLHTPLGPVLPEWPAGLVLHVTLQGDVIQEAAAEVLDAASVEPFWTAATAAARELDGLARFLAVAGWAHAAAAARRIRDDLLVGADPGTLADPVDALVRRVRRSRTLAWLMRGLPAGPLDVAAHLGRRLDAVQNAVRSGTSDSERPHPADLPDLLVGSEFAAARLVVAVLDPDTETAAVRSERPDG